MDLYPARRWPPQTYADDVQPEEPITLAKLAAAVARVELAGMLATPPSSSLPWSTFEPFGRPWMVRAPADQLPEGAAAKLDALDIPTRPEPTRYLPPGALAVVFDGGWIKVLYP